MAESPREVAHLHAEEIFDVHEAARYLKINEQTLRRLAREKQIPSFKVGGSWRFMRSRLDRWSESQQHTRRAPHILVVDDESIVRSFFQRVLESKGFRVTAAGGGREALELFSKEVPDLVILDLMMPDMNGAETLREIRMGWEFVPVIIITGYPDSELMSQALHHSPFALLPKPAVPDQLLEAVKWAIGRENLPPELTEER